MSKKLHHVAIIMDGNGRWAQQRSHPRVYGHVKGTRIAKKIITECSRLGVKHLTLYAFSTENWFRPTQEIQLLMNLLRKYLKRETENLIKENIRFTTIGDTDRLPLDVIKTIEHSKQATAHCTGAAPRNFGSSDPCTLTAPKRASGNRVSGRIR